MHLHMVKTKVIWFLHIYLPEKKNNNLILYIPREEIAKCEQAAKGGKFRLGKYIH